MTEIFSASQAPLLTVIGEALIDLVPNGTLHEYRARPGGSPFNVAIGLARLGNRTRLMARLADNAFGRLLREYATAEQLDLSLAPLASEPTSLAVVSLDAEAKASYDFYLDGTADWQWMPAELAQLPLESAVIHFGSIASWMPPGSEHIQTAISAAHARGQQLISYDPNVRPSLMAGLEQAPAAIEANIGSAHIAKASREDVEWLYPDSSIEQVAARWLDLGALLVVITDGPAGAHAYRSGDPPLHRTGRTVQVVDTVGAGDSFTAGLLNVLVRQGLRSPESLRRAASDALLHAIDEAILVSSLTCERAGADPPILIRQPEPHGRFLTRADLEFKH